LNVGAAPIRPDIAPFHGVGINRLANARARQGLPVIHMEVGQPTARPPEVALAAARRALDGGALGYWESEALKERIAAHYAEWYGVELEPQRVLLTAGASGIRPTATRCARCTSSRSSCPAAPRRATSRPRR